MPRVSGFTVIELMFVVALVAVLLTIGAPALHTMIINNRISTAAGDLISDFTFARATAIGRAQRVSICASNDQATCNGASWGQGWIVFTDANADGDFDAGTDNIVRVREALAPGLTVTPTPNALGIQFRPSGPADAARRFQVCKPGFVGRNVDLNATGRAISTATPAACT
ncbi:MAG TPA: GspH/FimT family pseudopilin [Burkholderiales bacterium]|jgi:type IV fimbrial biogenesis protein FimT